VPGTDTPHQFVHKGAFGNSLGNLSYIEPMKQLVVRSPLSADAQAFSAQNFGAAEIKLNVPIRTITGGSVSVYNIRVIQDDMYIKNAASQTNMNWSREGDIFTVNFTSPLGMKYYEPRFSIIANTYRDCVILNDPAPSITSVKFFDLNGSVVTGAAPDVADYTATLE